MGSPASSLASMQSSKKMHMTDSQAKRRRWASVLSLAWQAKQMRELVEDTGQMNEIEKFEVKMQQKEVQI